MTFEPPAATSGVVSKLPEILQSLRTLASDGGVFVNDPLVSSRGRTPAFKPPSLATDNGKHVFAADATVGVFAVLEMLSDFFA